MKYTQNQLPRVAYFCMEYGLHEQLPIYAGGLGVLAGDFMKAAHDLEVPMVGLGILWRNDYTEQFIGQDGRPYDNYPHYDYKFLKDTGVTVQLRIRGMDVTCKIHLADQYSNAPLYLLDAAFEGSPHAWMTSKLYGGEAQDRIAQEMILGIGGLRALRALGIEVDCYHFNEGHAVFAGLELIREQMSRGASFESAWQQVRQQIVFTTHTPVAAGNEVHDHGLLQHMEANNGLTQAQMQAIGSNPFNMTVAALRLSKVTNAVSKLHGQTARKMWGHVENASPIISITNGVHNRTWQDTDIHHAYEHGDDIWDVHMKCKQELVDYIKHTTGQQLDPHVLTIGFARRAAAYKRSDLIFRNQEVIETLLRDKKIQLVFSGKAHPKDGAGKDIIAQLVQMDRKYADAVVFVPNYNMEVARKMIRGCDVWLNNPRRPLEASGTSGMKAAMNGVLNLSVVDGWVAEGLQHAVSGWLLHTYLTKETEAWRQDEIDLQNLYQVLLNEVIPTFYDNKQHWQEMMRASIDMAHWQFSSHRMMREYYDMLYARVTQAQRQPQAMASVYTQAHHPQQYNQHWFPQQ